MNYNLPLLLSLILEAMVESRPAKRRLVSHPEINNFQCGLLINILITSTRIRMITTHSSVLLLRFCNKSLNRSMFSLTMPSPSWMVRKRTCRSNVFFRPISSLGECKYSGYIVSLWKQPSDSSVIHSASAGFAVWSDNLAPNDFYNLHMIFVTIVWPHRGPRLFQI
jgi:hypothetical protein